jgi:hypothetical protein
VRNVALVPLAAPGLGRVLAGIELLGLGIVAVAFAVVGGVGDAPFARPENTVATSEPFPLLRLPGVAALAFLEVARVPSALQWKLDPTPLPQRFSSPLPDLLSRAKRRLVFFQECAIPYHLEHKKS